MTLGTYTGSYAYLVEPLANPATFTSTARVTESQPVYYGATYSAVLSIIGGTIFNSGTLTASYGVGVYFAAGGALINQSGGYISGRYDGVFISQPSGTASIVNVAGATISSPHSFGVQITGAAIIDNGGLILGYPGGIDAAGGAATVTNSGAILGTNGAVDLAAGGSITNSAGGTIRNTNVLFNPAVVIGGAPGTVTNLDLIEGGTQGIYLVDGGTVTNAAGASIDGIRYGIKVTNAAGTIINSGAIDGAGSHSIIYQRGYGIDLAAGGTIVNEAGAFITGRNGGVQLHGAGVVTDYGRIYGGYGNSVFFSSSADVLQLGAGAHLYCFAYGEAVRWRCSAPSRAATQSPVSEAALYPAA